MQFTTLINEYSHVGNKGAGDGADFFCRFFGVCDYLIIYIPHWAVSFFLIIDTTFLGGKWETNQYKNKVLVLS